jgi:hypothetical protein
MPEAASMNLVGHWVRIVAFLAAILPEWHAGRIYARQAVASVHNEVPAAIR